VLIPVGLSAAPCLLKLQERLNSCTPVGPRQVLFAALRLSLRRRGFMRFCRRWQRERWVAKIARRHSIRASVRCLVASRARLRFCRNGAARLPAADLLEACEPRLRPWRVKTPVIDARHGPRQPDNHSIYTIDWSGKLKF